MAMSQPVCTCKITTCLNYKDFKTFMIHFEIKEKWKKVVFNSYILNFLSTIVDII